MSDPLDTGHHASPLRASAKVAMEILAERDRQVTQEGWTPEHDDAHTDFELARAAAAYAEQPWRATEGKNTEPGDEPIGWPWDADWWRPADDRRNLIKAAALIVAEIERLDRAAVRP